MNFDALKEQLRDQWQELWGKIQENPSFQTLKERFESLSQNAQLGIVVGVVALLALFILSFPYSYISTSSDSMATFEDNRSLIRDLLQASRSLREPSPLPPGMSADDLKTQISSILNENRLVPEQIVDIQPTPGKPAGKLTPSVVQQEGVSVALKTLNLKQIVDLGHRFQSLNAGVKVTSLDIVRSSKDAHYYDAVYKVVSFSLPNLNSGLSEPSGNARPSHGGIRSSPSRPSRASSPTPPPEPDESSSDTGSDE